MDIMNNLNMIICKINKIEIDYLINKVLRLIVNNAEKIF